MDADFHPNKTYQLLASQLEAQRLQNFNRWEDRKGMQSLHAKLKWNQEKNILGNANVSQAF